MTEPIHNLCTGARGFIGKHLLTKLKGSTFPVRHEQIANMWWGDCVNFFYLSAYGNMAGQNYESEMMYANVIQPTMVLKWFQDNKTQCKNFVYVSSSSVTLPVLTAYARTKSAAEQVVQSSTLPTCIVRPYSIFGTSEQPSHLIPTLIRSCMEGELVNFVPWPVHDWIAVDDVVEALLFIADNEIKGVYGLGMGTGLSNAEVLGVVEKATGKKANLAPVNSLRGYDSENWICRDFAIRKHGWYPKRKFEDVVREVVEDYRKLPEKYARPNLLNL